MIGIDEISRRIIGEMPISSTKTPEQRAQELMARDLVDLRGMLINRRSQQASEILQTGKVTVKAFADDGALEREDVIEFDWTGARQKDWTAASEEIQENAGIVPTLLICGKNVEGYMTKNKEMKEWLLSANSNATKYINYEPRYQSPQVRYLGYLAALGLEMVSYSEKYLDDAGAPKSFIDPDTCIICCPGRGRSIYGRVDVLEGRDWHSYSAEYVPVYRADENDQITSLTMFSRFLLIPEDVSDWITLTVKP